MGTARAQTAQEMKSYCVPVVSGTALTDGRVLFEQNFLSGMCWGAIGTLQSLSRVYTDRPMMNICAPEDSTLTQYAIIFSAYTDRHPERLHEDWVVVAWRALVEAFPCDSK